MKNRVWLSSYPKSGNTWLRVLLESIFYHNGGQVDINRLKITSTSIIRQDFNHFFGIESSDLTIDETWEYKREYLLRLAKKDTQRKFVKTHDANLLLNSGLHLFPQEVTELAIQVVRNPLDIVSSFANHMGITNDQSIEQLNSINYFSFEKKEHLKSTSLLYAKSMNWSDHIASWLEQKEFPVHLVKYEEILANPHKIITEILAILGESVEEGIIQKAIGNTSFESLSRFEKEKGFLEKSPFSNRFFRKGKAGGWKKELTQKQIEKVKSDHSAMMEKMGYL